MKLLDIQLRGAPFAYRYGIERELWIANLAKREKVITSFVYDDDAGDPILRKFSIELDDFQYTDWSILSPDDRQ